MSDKNKIRTIAFYLPQFHTIPENDQWWGRGFTEWTNVKKAKPLFEGHYQPHIPTSELGYYDLSNPEILIKQAAIAKEHGIYGFCFYYYWFNGKKLLDLPLSNMLKSGKPDFPFCICWANENWTRRWDGQENDILISQKHSDEDDQAFINELIPIFKDRRYIQINGKPLVIIYRTELLPDPKKTAEIWRKIAREKGVGEIYLARVESFTADINPEEIGFDAAIEFAPDWRNLGEKINLKKYSDEKCENEEKQDSFSAYDYESNVNRLLSKQKPDYKIFHCAYPSWDNAPRRGLKATLFLGSSPKRFEYFLKRQLLYTDDAFSGEEKILFINAWNEWGEGCHLEPDEMYGMSYLKICRELINNSNFKSIKSNFFQSKIDKLELLICEDEKQIDKLKKDLKEKEQLENLIEQKNQTIQQRNQEIELMRSSKFWKIREYYLKFKFLIAYPARIFSKNKQRIYFAIFHPIKFIVKYSAFFQPKKCEIEEKIISIKRDCDPKKKTIIFVDNNVPTYDKDAGSRTVYQYMKLFLEMNFNVILIPDNFYPTQPYTEKLKKMGVKVLYGPWYFKNWRKWLIDNKEVIDYFFLNRSGISTKYLEVIKGNLRAKVIYYPVDITYIRELRQYEITKEGYLLKDIEIHKGLESFMFKNSDAVVTISEYEKDVIKKDFPEAKVFIIPTFIYDQSFPIKNGESFRRRRDLLFVGGFLHLPNADGIKWFIKDVFPLIKKEISDIKINIIGSNTPEEISNLASPDIKILGFVSDKELEENYSKTRIVVAPLRYGAGVKGKIIEAIAYGVPVVTTKIGAEGIINKEDVLLVGDNEQDFAKKVIETYSNNGLWQSLRDCQIKYAKSFLSKESAKKIIKNLLNKI